MKSILCLHESAERVNNKTTKLVIDVIEN